MKLLLRCLIASVVLLAIAGFGAALTFNAPLAMIGWPGLVLMNAIYAQFGIYVRDFKTLLPWLLPGFLVDVVLYTAVFFMVAKLWRTVNSKPVRKPQ